MLELKEAIIVSEKFDGTVKDEIRTDLLNKIYEVAQTPDWGYEDQSEVDDFMTPQVDVANTEDGKIKVEVRAEFSDYDSQRQMAEALDEVVSKYDTDAYFDDEDMGIMNAYLDLDSTLKESLQEGIMTGWDCPNCHEKALFQTGKVTDDPKRDPVFQCINCDEYYIVGEDNEFYSVSPATKMKVYNKMYKESLEEDATQVSNIGQHKRAEIDMTESDNPEDSEMIKSLDKMTESIADDVRASQDIKEMTRRSIQLIGNYVQYYKDHPDEIDDSNRDLVKDTEAAYNKLKSEFEATYSTSLDEAYYGGAYDIDPEMYFTRDDYVDFAYQIIDEVAEDTGYTLDIEEINVIDNSNVRIIFSNDDGAYTTDVHIDYRRIRKPSDLSRYLDSAVKDIEGKIKEFNSMFEGLQLKVTESVSDFEEYSGNVTYNAYRMVSDMRHYLQSHPEEKSNVLNLRRQVGDIFNKAYLESVNESLEGEDGWSEEIVDLFYDFLNKTDSLAYEMHDTVRGAETGARTVSELVTWLVDLSSQLDDIIGNLEGSEDVLEENFHVGDEVEWDEDDKTKRTSGVIKSFTLTNKDGKQVSAAVIGGREIPVEKLRLKEEQGKVNFKDAHICQGCGKPLSQCTCEVEEEDLKD